MFGVALEALAGWGQGDPGTGPGKRATPSSCSSLLIYFITAGAAVKESGLPREELFITTKAMTTGYRATKLGIDNSLTEAGLDYFDLMLIHWPMQDDLGTYRALEEAYQAGKLRSIGVSNFNRAQLGEITANFQTVPVLKDLAAKYDHTTAQVMLRYLTQRQIMVIPRSTNPAHMAANINIFDFALTAADLARVQALDEKFSLSGWPSSMTLDEDC
ncbi:aldo/keto reductase [Limosilactobacillus fermentum]